MVRCSWLCIPLLAATALAAMSWDAVAAVGMRPVSVDRGGGLAGEVSDGIDVSADGRYVAFVSAAGNLVAGDTNGASDLFMRDTLRARTERVSVSSSGRQIGPENYHEGGAFSPSLSLDGRIVVFTSRSASLVPGDTNTEERCEDVDDCYLVPAADVFVHDRIAGTTRRVSVSSAGRQANGSNYFPVVSGNGRFVAFHSEASNLVRGDNNRLGDVFIRDLSRRTTRRVSISTRGRGANGTSANATISDNGRYVAFTSRALNLAPATPGGVDNVFLRDVRRATTTRIGMGVRPVINLWHSVISGDGRFIASRINGHIYVRDRFERRTVESDINERGEQANAVSLLPSLSSSGRYVAFTSGALNLAAGPDLNGGASDVFVRDSRRGTTIRIPLSTDETSQTFSSASSISDDGRYVAFTSYTTTTNPFGTRTDAFIAGPLR
jgi:Tol biopolymer transport system component